jgi:nucleotide-binding universal stress UspA family protein
MSDADVGTRPRIVVGVDGSTQSRSALRWAARQAQLVGGYLDVIITWELPISFGWVPPYPPDFNPAQDAQRAAEEEVGEVLRDFSGLEARVTVVEGHPVPSLLKASRGADLLVLGSRGHGEYVGMLLGSVTQHCVTEAHCPVLVWRQG